MIDNRLTTKKHWDEGWKTNFKPKVVTEADYHSVFTGLFKKYLPYNKNYKCLEVGCVPGNLLIEFNKIFGYKIYGIDYSDRIDLFKKNMQLNKIKDYKIWQADILKFQTKIKFDVVFSYGLIEHFVDPTPHVYKMASLVKKGGYYIIHVPNFRYLQYILHYITDKSLFETHNLKYMNSKEIRKLVEKTTGIKTLYAGYYGVIQDFPYKNKFPHNFLHHLTHKFNILMNKFSLDLFLANPYTSTQTVYIGRKLK